MTPWHPKNNMTPTTKCCCWLALSKVVRFREGGETAKGRQVGVSQWVGPGHQRDSSLWDLWKLEIGKHDGDKCPLYPVSLKTVCGLPLMAGEGGGLCNYFHTTFHLEFSHLCRFHTRKGSFFGREPVSIFNHSHHTNSSSHRMWKLCHRLYLT